MNAIETRGLAKSYDGKVRALDGLDLAIPAGTVFSLLGPNGSGKTTTVRLLNGILSPTAGDAQVHGLSPVRDARAVRAMCGVMTETARAYERLDADENLTFFGRLHGLADADIRARADELLAFFDLTAARGRPIAGYSTGMKKRLLLAVALLHRPRVLFLDEPTSGLDPDAARDVYDLIRSMAREKSVTTFLCTHQLRYAEDVSSLFGFIAGGRLIACGTLDELVGKLAHARTLVVRGAGLAGDWASFRTSDDTWKIPVAGDDEAAAALARSVGAGARVFDARQARMGLEELYFAFLEGKPA